MTRTLTRRAFAKTAASAAALAVIGAPHSGVRRRRQQDLAVHRAIGSARARPDLDHRLYHPQSRLHGVRHAVRDRRRIRAAPADGRRLQRLRRQADSTTSRCATGSKFHDGAAGARHRLRRLDQALDGARRARPDAWPRCSTKCEPDGDKGFTIKLKEPFPLLIDGLAKVSSLAPFIMPERLAKTDPFQQVTEMIGSGPFKFVKDEFEPGHRVVYVKNTDYVPRSEPPSWASGGKVVKVDRVEWLYIPDAMTKAAALNGGEADWWENPPLDLLPVLAAQPRRHGRRRPTRSAIMTMVRFNHLQPPFDNVKMRQAVLAVADQADYHGGARRRPEILAGLRLVLHLRHADGERRRLGRADRQARFRQGQKADRRGRLQGREDRRARRRRSAQPACAGAGHRRPAEEARPQCRSWPRWIGAPWSPAAPRRSRSEKGGWNIFGTGWVGADMLDPALNVPLRTNGEKAWFGWPNDDKLEALRAQWIKPPKLDERKKLAAAIQQRAYEVVPYIPTGQWTPMTAYRKNVKGIAPAPAFLDVERREGLTPPARAPFRGPHAGRGNTAEPNVCSFNRADARTLSRAGSRGDGNGHGFLYAAVAASV